MHVKGLGNLYRLPGGFLATCTPLCTMLHQNHSEMPKDGYSKWPSLAGSFRESWV